MSKDILCSCHARAKMAELDGWKLTIQNKQYGEKHHVVLDIREEYNRLKRLEDTGAPQSAVSRASENVTDDD